METLGPQEGRALGAQERLYYQLNQRGGLLMTVAYVIVSRDKHPVQVFVDAFELVSRLHPMLRMCVKRDASQQFVFEPIEDFQVNFAVRESEASLCREMEKEMTTAFPEGGALWRVVYIPRGTPSYATAAYPHQYVFLLVFAHAISDAGGIRILVKDAYDLLMKASGLLKSDGYEATTHQPIPAAIHGFADEYLDRKMKTDSSRSQFVNLRPKFPLESLVNRNQWRDYLDEDGLPQELSSKPESGVVLARLPAEDVVALQSNLKKHQVSMTSFATAALSVAMHQLLPSENTEVLTQASTDLRLLAAKAGLTDATVLHQVVPRSISLWTRPINLKICDDTAIWALARLCQEQLHGGDLVAEVFEYLDGLEDVGEKSAATNVSDPVSCHGMTRGDLAIMSFGSTIPLAQKDSPFKLAKQAAAIGEHYMGRPVSLVLGITEGHLDVTLTYATHRVSEKTARKLLDRFLVVATAAAKTS